MPMKRSRYPQDWEAISRRIRFERAKGQCERCGAVHGARHPETGSYVVLTVAHLNHDPSDNRPSNLMAMCQRCHLAHDADEHARNAAETRKQRKLAQGQLMLW